MDENGKQVPDEVRGWNWGAFVYNIFWGIGNKTYLPLLCLIPVFNFFWIFVVGFKGNTWAWEKGDYDDIATFKAVQKTWNRAGLVQFIVSITLTILYFVVFFVLFSAIGSSHSFY